MENQIQEPLTIQEDQILFVDEVDREIESYSHLVDHQEKRNKEYRKQYIGELDEIGKKLLQVNAFFADPNEFDTLDTVILRNFQTKMFSQHPFTNRDYNRSVFDYKIPDKFSLKKKPKKKRIKRRRRSRRRKRKKSKKLLIVLVSVVLLAFVWHMIKDITI
jgi:hypothetical protein